MTDCYRILGVGRRASAAEIRAAFLAKMKSLHPDARRDGDASDGSAGEISSAYWQLRDPDRRAEHDRLLFADADRRPAPGRVASLANPRPALAKRQAAAKRQTPAMRHAAARAKPAVSQATASPVPAARRPRRSRRLQPLRTAAGFGACMVAGIGFVIAYNYLDPRADAEARSIAALDTSGRQAGQVPRRSLDPAPASAAAEAFHETMRRSGLEGAHHYARQCLLELVAHPTLSMLDYCVAFDDQAAGWEAARPGRDAAARRYFAEAQRFGRYQNVVRGLKPGNVRTALLADVDFFAAAQR